MALESFLTGFFFTGGETPRKVKNPAERKLDGFTAILQQGGIAFSFSFPFLFLVFFLFLWYNKRKKLLEVQQLSDAQEAQKGGKKMLTEQAIAARREYKNKWARKNPEKIRAQQERFWQKRAAEQQAQQAQQAPPAPQVEAEKNDF